MIYFDHSATSYPKPECVKQAVYESFALYGNAGRGAYPLSLQASRLVYKTRECCKSFFQAGSDAQVVFTGGATESLNIIIQGMLGREDHVITTVLEHNAVLRPLYDLQEKGVTISFLACDEQGVLEYEQMEELIQPHTKMMLCTYASNVTGTITNIKAISALCHQHHIILVVDAAQSAGHIPFSMEEDDIDILCFSGHKGLLSPTGIGGIIMRKDYVIRPLIHGGTGFDSFAKHQPLKLPEHLEAGTLAIHAIAGLYAGMNYISEIGIANIHHHETALASLFYEQIRQLPDLHVIGDYLTSAHCAIISFYIDGLTSDEIADRLGYDYGIAVRGGVHCAPLVHLQFHTEQIGLVRFSFGYENTVEEVYHAVQAIKEMIGVVI